MKRHIRLKINNDLKKGVANVFLTIASLLFVFVAVDSVVDMSKYIHGWIRIVYWILTVLFFAIGCFVLASIEESSVDKYGIRMVDFTKRPHFTVNVDMKNIDSKIQELDRDVEVLKSQIHTLYKKGKNKK